MSLLATGAWWARSADRLPLLADPTIYELELEAPLVTVAEALVHYEEGAYLFVDSRLEAGTETIPGAFAIRAETFDDDLLDNFDFIYPEDTFILFGDGNLTLTSNVAGRMIERGYLNVVILQGGISAWKKGGGETSPVKSGAES